MADKEQVQAFANHLKSLKEETLQEAAPKKASRFSMQDQIDQNRKTKDGTGQAKIDDATYDWIQKKFGKASGSTVTSKAKAIQDQKVQVHKPKGRSGVITTTISPIGDYLMVHSTSGAMGEKPKVDYYKV